MKAEYNKEWDVGGEWDREASLPMLFLLPLLFSHRYGTQIITTLSIQASSVCVCAETICLTPPLSGCSTALPPHSAIVLR